MKKVEVFVRVAPFWNRRIIVIEVAKSNPLIPALETVCLTIKALSYKVTDLGWGGL